MKKTSTGKCLCVVATVELLATTSVMAQWINPLQMQINIATENSRVQLEASRFSSRMFRMDDEEKRDAFEEWKDEVEDLINGGDMLGAAREWTVKERAMWTHRHTIEGDCITWFKKMRDFWQRTMERQQRQIQENMESMSRQIQSPAGQGRTQGIKCPRCGDTYYGQFTCPRCSVPNTVSKQYDEASEPTSQDSFIH